MQPQQLEEKRFRAVLHLASAATQSDSRETSAYLVSSAALLLRCSSKEELHTLWLELCCFSSQYPTVQTGWVSLLLEALGYVPTPDELRLWWGERLGQITSILLSSQLDDAVWEALWSLQRLEGDAISSLYPVLSSLVLQPPSEIAQALLSGLKPQS
jgi:hypothetical protein